MPVVPTQQHRGYGSLLNHFGEDYDFWSLRLVISDVCNGLRESLGWKEATLDKEPSMFRQKNLWGWRKFNLLPVSFLNLVIIQDLKLGLPGKPWIKPAPEFYRLRDEDIVERVGWVFLDECWCLVDFTPAKDFGTQADPLWPLLASLRTSTGLAHRIAWDGDTPVGSRFDISPQDWKAKVCPAFEQLILDTQARGRCRLERGIQQNAIFNMYDPVGHAVSCQTGMWLD